MDDLADNIFAGLENIGNPDAAKAHVDGCAAFRHDATGIGETNERVVPCYKARAKVCSDQTWRVFIRRPGLK